MQAGQWGQIFPVLLVFFWICCPATCADMISPAITHVYFEKDGVPYTGSVQYSVNCYGYFMHYPPVIKRPGSYTPELIFSYTATCPGYGCEINQPYYYLGHSDWCDLEGQTENEWFEIRNFSPYPYSRCNPVWERLEKQWGDTREYYYYTPEYSLCRQVTENSNELWYASSVSYSETPGSPNRTAVLLLPGYKPLYRMLDYNSSVVSRSDIPHNISEYIAYLETCDPVTDSRCGGWIVNGTALKTYAGLRPLKDNTTDLLENPCDRFLMKADPSLIMPFTDSDPWSHPCAEACNFTYEICESRFTIPSGNPASVMKQKSAPTGTVPWTIIPRPFITPYDTTAVTVPPSQQTPAMVLRFSRSPVESLYCSIVELLGGRCE